jgi:hypothetical protein
MAFCPNCGKPVTEQASKCLACGQEFEPRAKSARFKGTMMMTPATAPQPPAAATPAAPAAPPAAAKPQPSPAAAAPAPRPTAPGPSKVAKATMLGTGGLGFAPPAGLGAKPGAPVQPPPAAGAGAPLARPQAAAPEPAPAAPQVQPAGGGQDPAADDSQRFLVGDPMAPAPAAQRGARRAGREDGEGNVPVQRTTLLLVIGVIGMAVIAAVGYATARFMGLVQ